ncbi:MAG: DUF4013 domain-containing protein [Anaerolineales bacterium]|nr:DUF4013 domain-containing protein [Anaerolineales bacterium]
MSILIGVVGFLIVMGYCVRLLRNIGNGDRLPLPEWDDWGGDLTRGFKLAVVSFVWALPMILLSLPVAISGIFMGIGSENDAGFFTAIGGIGMSFGYCLLLLYGIFYALVTPGFTLWYARTDEISGGLRFTEIWHWTREHLSSVISTSLRISWLQS